MADTTAGVRFPYTFFSLGLVLLESVSVFALNGQLLTASSGGGSGSGSSNASRMSLWRSPLPAAPVTVGGADAVRIMQRAEVDVVMVPAGGVEGMCVRPGSGAADDAQSLTATLAAAHFTASSEPPHAPGMMWSL